jgi:hypothetical protein
MLLDLKWVQRFKSVLGSIVQNSGGLLCILVRTFKRFMRKVPLCKLLPRVWKRLFPKKVPPKWFHDKDRKVAPPFSLQKIEPPRDRHRRCHVTRKRGSPLVDARHVTRDLSAPIGQEWLSDFLRFANGRAKVFFGNCVMPEKHWHLMPFEGFGSRAFQNTFADSK